MTNILLKIILCPKFKSNVDEAAFQCQSNNYEICATLIHELAHKWHEQYLWESDFNSYVGQRYSQEKDYVSTYSHTNEAEDVAETTVHVLMQSSDLPNKALANLRAGYPALANKMNYCYRFFDGVPDQENWIVRAGINRYFYQIGGEKGCLTLLEGKAGDPAKTLTFPFNTAGNSANDILNLYGGQYKTPTNKLTKFIDVNQNKIIVTLIMACLTAANFSFVMRK